MGLSKQFRLQTGQSTSCLSQQKKYDFINLANRLHLLFVGIVREVKERLKICSSSLKSGDILDNIKANVIHF